MLNDEYQTFKKTCQIVLVITDVRRPLGFAVVSARLFFFFYSY